jgi:hypothetical protein
VARIIQKFDWGQVNRTSHAERSDPYPWDKWLDGRIHLLTYGEDFLRDPNSFIRVARTSANRGSATREPVGVRVRRGPFDSIEGSTEDNVILQAHQEGAAAATYTVTKGKRFDTEPKALPEGKQKALPKAEQKALPAGKPTKAKAVKAVAAAKTTARPKPTATKKSNVVALPAKPVPSKRRALKVG